MSLVFVHFKVLNDIFIVRLASLFRQDTLLLPSFRRFQLHHVTVNHCIKQQDGSIINIFMPTLEQME